MRARTSRHFAVATVLAALVLPAACGTGDDSPGASEGLEIDGRSTSSSSASEPWRKDYDADQLKAYESALQRWTSYEELLEPITAEGRATPEAKDLFQDHFPSPAWKARWAELRTHEQYEVRTSGLPEVLWSRATAISDAGDSVTIEQCVDWRTTQTTQWGKPTQPVASRQEPVLREIALSRPEGAWLVYALVTTPGKNKQEDVPCDPTP